MALVTSPNPPHLILSGEVDLSVADACGTPARRWPRRSHPARLEIDLGDVTFIDSSGLGALIALRNTAQECGATLVLVQVSPAVARFFELAGVRDSFTDRMTPGRRRS